MYIVHALVIALALLASPAAYSQVGQTDSVNAPYKNPDLAIDEWIERFESEGREAFDFRKEIVAALGLSPGQTVADVGAGTGLFVPLLAEAVGAEGKVYAVDIAPRFIRHIEARAKQAGLTQVHTVLSTERSIRLPANSLDLIFTCDAYHHFVHYQDMLASMRQALKPGGRLVIVEFDIEAPALPAQMRQHVGRTKQDFSQQIRAAGFAFAEDLTLDEMKTNFIYSYVKTPAH
jgi:ubiquinone/menaquinone biosynthesis C-methylase UbiE